ncbi:FtsX-like permease family protein [Mucilaginibacter robiniae]|uniref:FtsX-like permease family protein n=1 Tax=Mucilaginibacter robiniae TaxID=2728022 RepID=A0A7L5E5S7_9SPHI|nr:ABC transporter permease [Mucilaginibacter robiniae]QJD97978.1 FtsX-like permease family protein [Mucilaginibacter robiniae]
MLKNYIKTAWRNLLRSKVYSLIAVIGLAIGLSVSILVFWGANDELLYDQSWPDANHVFRINAKVRMSSNVFDTWSSVPAPIAAALKDFPAVEQVARFQQRELLITSGESHLMENSLAFTEPAFFSMFHIHFLQGNLKTALQNISSVAISKDAAIKYFGSVDKAIGKTLLMDEKQLPYTVSAIYENMPERSSIHFNVLLSIDVLRKDFGGNGKWKTIDDDWGNFAFNTFLHLKSGTNVAALAKQLSAIHVKNNGYVKPGDVTFIFQPINTLRLYKPDLSPSGIKTVKLFFIIGILIIVIAVINYINLSTARATKRAKEVGLRRTIGANRKQLLIQFVTEFVLIFLASLLLAMLLLPLLVPIYKSISGKTYTIDYWQVSTFEIIGWVGFGTIILGSFYPAWVLSSFNPTEALKSNFNKSAQGGLLRKSLVILQFAFSIVLIICTVIITKQLRFMQAKNLGYNRENIVIVPLNPKVGAHLQTILTELKADTHIQDVTFANSDLMQMGENSTDGISWPGKTDPQAHISPMQVTANFASTMQMKFAAGEGFTGTSADSAYYLINESAAKLMNLKKPLGTIVNLWGRSGQIRGVIRDFNNVTLKANIQPAIFSISRDSQYGGYLYVKINSENAQEALTKIEQVYRNIDAIHPFNYQFMDYNFQAMYRRETQTATLFKAFAGVAILLSCLGLFGLAVFTAERRTKEIGIRKVLGASVQSISLLISTEFTWLVVVANLIAWPLAWYFMHQWVQEFAFRTEINWWIFLITGCLSLLLAVVTVSSQAVKAAFVNPVKSLKTE